MRRHSRRSERMISSVNRGRDRVIRASNARHDLPKSARPDFRAREHVERTLNEDETREFDREMGITEGLLEVFEVAARKKDRGFHAVFLAKLKAEPCRSHCVLELRRAFISRESVPDPLLPGRETITGLRRCELRERRLRASLRIVDHLALE